MYTFVIVLRLVHIVLGVFWAGTIFFMALFLEPSVRGAGPGGVGVMQGLQQRGLLNLLPIAAGLTVLSGLVLYWRASLGLSGVWIHSPVGMSLTIGGLASLAALGIGVFGMRRSTLQAGKLGAELQQSSDESTRESLQAEIQQLRLRARTSLRWVAALLAITVVTMAVGRYL